MIEKSKPNKDGYTKNFWGEKIELKSFSTGVFVELPEESELDDDDDDDLNKIKAKIMATMSKIEQAEVD